GGKLNIFPVIINVIRRDDAVLLNFSFLLVQSKLLQSGIERQAFACQRKPERAQVDELSWIHIPRHRRPIARIFRDQIRFVWTPPSEKTDKRTPRINLPYGNTRPVRIRDVYARLSQNILGLGTGCVPQAQRKPTGIVAVCPSPFECDPAQIKRQVESD